MKRICKRIISVLLTGILVFGTLCVYPFAVSADIAVRTSESSYVQGNDIVVEVYFPNSYEKVASLNMDLKYNSSKLEIVSVQKGSGLITAMREQENGSVMSEAHNSAGKISWALAGSNNYKFSGIFAIVTFRIKDAALKGNCQIELDVTNASNSGYVDMTSSVVTQGCSFEIIRDVINDMTIELNSEKTGYVIKKYLTAAYDNLTIPSEHDGLPIVAIDSGVFQNHAEIKNLIIPDTITYIGHNAFSGCSGLESLVIPNSVKTIDSYAFEGCNNLKTLEMSVGVESIGEEAFANCSFLTGIELPFTLKSLGERVFGSCYSLKTVKISKNTVSIGKKAFINCPEDIEFITVSGNTALEQYIKDYSLTQAKVTLVKDISLGNIGKIVAQESSGVEITPPVTITLNDGSNVVKDTDYKVYYVHNMKRGTADVYVIGINGYGEGYHTQFEIKCDHSKAEKSLTKAATCVTDGYYSCYCPTCHESYREVIKATGHKSDKWIYDVRPTITKTGIKHKVCSVCSCVFEEKTVAPKAYPDLNGNKAVNSADALLVLNYAVGYTKVLTTEEQLINADTNGDGRINSADALNILKIAVGQIVIEAPKG